MNPAIDVSEDYQLYLTKENILVHCIEVLTELGLYSRYKLARSPWLAHLLLVALASVHLFLQGSRNPERVLMLKNLEGQLFIGTSTYSLCFLANFQEDPTPT
jgi:hypothetical protein